MTQRSAWLLGLSSIVILSSVGCSDDSKNTTNERTEMGGSGQGGAAASSAGGNMAGRATGGARSLGGGGSANLAGQGGAFGGASGAASGGSAAGNSSGALGGAAGATTRSGLGGIAGIAGRASSTLGGVAGIAGRTGSGGIVGTAGRASSTLGGASGNVGTAGTAGTHATPGPSEPAVVRGGTYFGFPERFNRYYADRAWRPSNVIYASPSGTGNGSSRTTPTSVANALGLAVPGTEVVLIRGVYSGCYELDSSQSGTYDNPIVLYGERNTDGSLGVTINCCSTGRYTCINLEAADYVAVDGFELVGGYYGVRAVGAGYPANEHQRGTAVMNSVGHGQNRDPFFTGQSDWYVIEACTAYDSGSGDGHGIYLSNGSDWNIARFNETYNTVSSDFQINADPNSTCADDGIAFTDPECDATAGTSTTGGRGASDYMLIEGNFFHHSLAQGPNFTSVRNSLIRNNIFALPARHGASFWQETDNPLLGSSHNVVVHNLFVTAVNNRQALGVTVNSTDNHVSRNVFVAVTINGTTVAANPSGQLLATDVTTVAANSFEQNAWISGFLDSDDAAAPYSPNSTELRQTGFDATWFSTFPTALSHIPTDFRPRSNAPWANFGTLSSDAPLDRQGRQRVAPVDLGPYEQ
jgi:hypothetical protein